MMWSSIFVFICGLLLSFCDDNGYCPVSETSDSCSSSARAEEKRYLYYDVNPSEGFNLRRDVYMRLAIFLHKWTKFHKEWVLVLPPWNHLYHWKSNVDQLSIPWSHFFNVDSLKLFAPVVDMNELKEQDIQVDHVYYLQHYPEAFASKDWDWSDKLSFVSCDNVSEASGKYFRYIRLPSKGVFMWGCAIKTENDEFYSFFLWDRLIRTKKVQCTSFQGGASLLGDVLQSDSLRKVAIDRAEIVLHDRFGDELYWKCRRSMQFAVHLVEEANRFRVEMLNSSDKSDDTEIPLLWTDQQEIERKDKGGPYVCAHLRRGDFLYNRKNEVPTMKQSALQLKNILKDLNLATVFVCSDGNQEELDELKKLLSSYLVVTYEPSQERVAQFKDGGIAIIDQIVCSNARYFIGSYESTYSFRIQEEREIRGFPTNTTFNRFCGSNEKCSKPSIWKIVF